MRVLTSIVIVLTVIFQLAGLAQSLSTSKEYFDKATLQYLVGEYDSALKNLNMSLRLDPNNAGAIELMKTIQRERNLPEEQPIGDETAGLVSDLITAGQEQLSGGEYLKASDYFSRALSIDPRNKEAARLFSQTEAITTQQRISASSWSRQRTLLWLGVSLVFLIIGMAALISYLSVMLRRSTFPPPKAPVKTGPAAPPPLAAARDQHKPIRAKWANNPFSLEVFKHEFTGEERMGFESLKNFIKSRIESVGGHGTEPFTETALEKINELSRGKPKMALIISDWAVNQANNQGMEKVTAELVKGYEKVAARNILIVDDEEVVRNTLDGILRRGGGYETDFAADGAEAIKKIQENVYGVVLLDLALPKVDGYEVLRQARVIHPELPVVFLTGTAEAHKVMESLSKYDLTALIEKPFSMEKVLDTVAKALKK